MWTAAVAEAAKGRATNALTAEARVVETATATAAAAEATAVGAMAMAAATGARQFALRR